MESATEELSTDVFLQRHPLNLAGCKIGRMVTAIRLGTGKLLVHSTADFSAADVAAIRELGEPAYLLEGSKFHDTLAGKGRAAFPDIPYLVPPEFKHATALDATTISPAADQLGDEVELIAVGGVPALREHVLFHRPTKTLVVTDLLFNLPPSAGRWTLGFMRVMSGMKEFPAMSRLFKFYIKDRGAFRASVDQILELDFERIVVAHGEPITVDAKAKFRETIDRDFGVKK